MKRRWVYGQAWGFWVGEERETEQETEAVSAKSGLFSQTLDDPRTTTKVAENLSLFLERTRGGKLGRFHYHFWREEAGLRS
ncbi:hypothetical protein ACOSQ3_021119 [Xanthoceras sorbifolium]